MQKAKNISDLPNEVRKGFNAIFASFANSDIEFDVNKGDLFGYEFTIFVCDNLIVPGYLHTWKEWREKGLRALDYLSEAEFSVVEDLWYSMLPPFGIPEDRYSDFFLQVRERLIQEEKNVVESR